jgi:hypothetical protein
MVARDLGPFGSHNGMLAMNEEESKAAVLINLKAEHVRRFALQGWMHGAGRQRAKRL